MDRRAAFKEIAAAAAQGKLAFPTRAELALKIRRTLDEPDCSLEHAAQVVQTEPLLAARVVAIANSITYNRSGRAITDVRTAVSRLGFRTVRSLATALVTRQMAGTPNDPELRRHAAELWEHTAHVAALASVIARRVSHLDPETALFAGIVHEVGGFYLISRAKDYPGILTGAPADWVEEGEKEISRAVLKALEVPQPVLEAIDTLLLGFMALPPVTLGDTLLLADDLAPVTSPLRRAPNQSREDPRGRIDAVIGEATLVSILEESAQEVESLTSALRF
ncbi:MAG: HDOD domain-containing protein [Azovibrio sp.]|nr:HDOD domain-containing protein [Azovibrio sp.]